MVERSLLTNEYRELLKDEPVTGQQARQYRMRMRERVTLGLEDISHLNQYARDSDIERIFHRSDTDERSHNALPDERDYYTKAHWVHALHMVALAWRGLRLNGMDKEEIFERVIQTGIAKGEADYLGIDRGSLEIDISLNTLQAHSELDELDPLEKRKRGLRLSDEEFQELTERLNEHPNADRIEELYSAED